MCIKHPTRADVNAHPVGGCLVAEKNGVAAVDRALTLVSACAESETPATLAELSERTGFYKSTILRLAQSLQRAGYVMRLQDGRYRLGPALLQLGNHYQATFRLDELVLPALRQLATETGESASFYVREGDTRVCLFRVHSAQHRVLHYVQVGTQFPLETGASGQILKRFEPAAVRAFAGEELTPKEAFDRYVVVSIRGRAADTAAVGVPVVGHDGIVGAITVAGPRARFDTATLGSIERNTLDVAVRLAEALGGPSQGLRLARMHAYGEAG